MKKGNYIKIAVYSLVFIVLIGFGLYYGMSQLGKSMKSASKQPDIEKLLITPIPTSIEVLEGEFILSDTIKIYLQGNNEQEIDELQGIVNYLEDTINKVTNVEIEAIKEGNLEKGAIVFTTTSYHQETGQENYALVVNADHIILSAHTTEGIFRATQSLLQLMMYDMDAEIWSIPYLNIFDYPQYEFRSMMLDVTRHFRTVAEVKQVIDYLALYKMNTLHLHLSDDQGFRIEIKSWPKLTEIGSTTQVGGGPGGFYTQEEYKDIVTYASQRYITIIPEIDMPGHTNAILSAYPELNPDNIAKQPYTGIEVGFSSLMCREEITYDFLEDVLSEIASLTPGPYLHIGGDEADATSTEDYTYFMGRVNDIVKSLGKTAIGWDPFETGDTVSSDAILQRWNGRTTIAEQKGMKIIVSQAQKAYIDMKYYQNTPIGLQWAAIINTKAAYDWKLTDYANKDNILGIECPLWAETIEDMDDLEYLMFPRLIGHAEKGWAIEEELNWDIYKYRLRQQLKILDLFDINYFDDPIIHS